MQTNSNYEARPEGKNWSWIMVTQVTYALPVWRSLCQAGYLCYILHCH